MGEALSAVDSFGCHANKIKVAKGHYVDLIEPDPSTIEIESIAAALSKICRFGGHCPKFYSVAEHCVHAAILAQDFGFGREAMRAVLLHDAAEAYIGDMVRPIKVSMPSFYELESRIERAIELAFGIRFAEHIDTITRFDRMMLKAEKRCFWPDDTSKWTGFDQIEDCAVSFSLHTPSTAERWFLSVAAHLNLKPLPSE